MCGNVANGADDGVNGGIESNVANDLFFEPSPVGLGLNVGWKWTF
jgi:hypothetical protein